MDGLTHKQLGLLHAALEQRRHLLLDQVTLATAGPAVEDVETSPADSASNRTMNQLQQETASHQLTQLLAIKHALAKFADGAYGCCENCGSEIGYSRLQARPEATLCIACQTQSERRPR